MTGVRGRACLRRRDEAGQVAGIEAIPFGVLVFVVGTLLVTQVWGVIDAKIAVSGAAREAARVFVEANVDDASRTGSVEAAARAAAQDAMRAHGRDPARTAVALSVDESSGAPGFVRCNAVTATVRYAVPIITLPWIGGHGPSVYRVTAAHTEVIDPLRTGVPGRATCDAAP